MTEPADDSGPIEIHDETHAPADAIKGAVAALKAAGDNGANWFFWIAGLSLVNTAILHAGGSTQFIVGLAVTLFVDATANEIGKQEPQLAAVMMMIAIGFSVFVAVAACMFGWLSRKRILWIFGSGMFVYLLDGLIFLLFGDFLSAAFHGYALFSMFQGFNAYRKLTQLEVALANAAADESASEHAGE
jgi:hypothetical protein